MISKSWKGNSLQDFCKLSRFQTNLRVFSLDRCFRFQLKFKTSFRLMKTLILKVAVNVGNTSFSGFSLQFFLLQILSKSPSDSVVVTYCWSYFKIFWVLDNFWQPESGNVIFDQKIFRGLSETSNKFDIRPSFGCLNIFVRSVWKEAVGSWKRTALWFCPKVWKYV